MLNLPISISKKLENCNNILIVGAGGGSDILCGLPLYYSFLKQGKKVHLANLTHTDFKTINEHAEPIVLNNSVFGATSLIKVPSQNYVEGYLSQYFKSALNEEKTVWMINRTHISELKKAFERLVEHLKIDGIVLVDGGVDSIMRGDEGKEILTNKFIDTSLVLSIVQQMEMMSDKIIFAACNDNSKNSRIINNNISNISLQGGFFGGCYVVDYMNSYKLMKSAYMYENINGNILPNIKKFIKLTDSDFEEGDEKLGLVQYLFFNPQALVYNNVVIHKVLDASSYYDIIQIIAPFINKVI